MQKTTLSNRIVPTLLILDGILCAGVAVFAYQLGIDSNIEWSAARFIILFFGIILILISFLSNKIFGGLSARPTNIFNVENIKTLFLLAHLWVIIFIIYAWFITYGNFTTWDRTTHYYTQLADVFNSGHLYLDRQPSQELLASDPNDPNGRPVFDDEVWDLSLYKGKFYLYWGPIPALLIAPLQRLSQKPITDIYLVYFFLAGLLIFNSLIIVKLWRSFFPQLSAWKVFFCIPLIAFIAPIPWSLNIPQVYQAAIGAGQFFLMSGLYFSLLAMLGAKSPLQHRVYFFLAGICWACSVGSRAINVFSILFFTALICFWIAKPFNAKKYIQDISALLTPLIIGAILIGSYNWARFDSPFEFGLRYQITIFNLNRHMDWVFQADYFFLNLYHYIFQPFEIIAKFPFIKPIINTNFPETYFYAAGPVTGLLFSAPFLVFASALLFLKNKNQPAAYHFFIYLLAGSFFINLLTLLFYFFCQTRFLADLISQITLLAILGYWRLSAEIKRRAAFAAIANLLIIVSISVGILLSFSSETNRLPTLNPQMIEKIQQFFP